MVISYRNKFLKIFLIAFSLTTILVLYLVIYMLYLTYGNDVNEASVEFLALTIKFLVPLGILIEILYLWSIYLLLKAKGYSGWLTCLGLINIIGFAIVALLPDRRKNG